ncbi:UNVERIFIED_CONTAM: hypothetical protein GTU68_032342 [Idotea baltica]|nr:hypothetical protein [Idotea baltica]
MSAFHEID